MTKRTRVLLPTLLPLLSSVWAPACSEDSAPSDAAATASPTDGTATPSTGPSTSAPGTPAPTGPGATGSGPVGSEPTSSGPTGPTGPTGAMGGSGNVPSGTPSMGGSGNPGNPSAGANAGNPGGNVGNPGGNGAGAAGGAAPVGGDAGSGGGTPSTPPDVLTVQLAEVKQIIRGFGVNATIMPDGESLPWQQLFTLEGPDALGLSILRIGMHEEGGHRNVPSDWETARTLGARVIGSCWSAPAGWKTNNSTTGGGHLLPDYYDDWATRIANYANEHNLYAMSIGNETDFASCSPDQGRPCSPPLTDEYESMVYTGKELADFVKVAGPIFDEIAPDTQVIAPEASLWIHVWSNLSPTNAANGGYDSSDPLGCNCFSNVIDEALEAAECDPKCTEGEEGYDYGHWLARDEAAWNAFDIMGVHEYESQVGYAWPADVTGGVRSKEVWQTEMSGVMYWPEQGPSIDIENGVAVARWIHSALTVGEASAWLYWWYEAYYQNDNEGLGLLKNRDGVTNPTDIAKRYYALGNFSRFIRPDTFHAVQVAGPAPDDVMVSAYMGDGGEVVIVAINETSQPVEVPITIAGGTAPASMTPWVTSAADNLVAKEPVALAAGVLPASLPAMSVTSFVSD